MKDQKMYLHYTIKILYRFVFGIIALVLFILGLFCILNTTSACAEDMQGNMASARAEEVKAEKVHPENTIKAVRINPTPPKIDGILDDEVWQDAPASGDFLQKKPNEGELPTEKTTVQIVYDDEALYVGVMCYDTEPDKIVARLSRRDECWVESDWVRLNLDAYHDHQTGCWFSVNAAGVHSDAQIYNDGPEDCSWDGVWEAKAAIHHQGWSVEYRIPFHVLRFSPKEEYTWGMNLGRYISRKNEQDSWVLVRQGESGWVSRFGHVEGIRGIHPPRHLEVMPFAVGRSTFSPENPVNPDGRDFFSSTGVDMRYGLSSNISVNATINPDFGQVEADPAGLNLTAFETFYEERRPFFVEGKTIFKTPGSSLFYTRRIGKQPGRFPIPDGSELIDKPNATTIFSAAKLSGKTASKTAFGIVNALTSREYATIERTYTDPITGLEQARQEKHLIEPRTNFFVGRIKQDVMNNSNVGAMITAVNRESDVPAYTAEIDGNLKWRDGKYSLSTRLAGSHTGAGNDRKNGYEAVAHFKRWEKWIGGDLNLDIRSPGFDVNDLGFMNRSNMIDTFAAIHGEINKPWLVARRSMFWLCAFSNWNYDGVNLRKSVLFFKGIELTNNGWFEAMVSRNFAALDDMGTRGGPLMIKPASISYWTDLWTDGRRPVSVGYHIEGARSDNGTASSHGFHFGIGIRPASNIQVNIGPSYRTGYDYAQWVRNIDDAEGTHYVFGELNSKVLDLSTRVNLCFTTNLSFQLYIQPFVAVGDYSNFKELARPESYKFNPYTKLDFNPDFVTRSLRGNAVLRWEYRPGSVLFLVWSQSRSASMETDNPSLKPYYDLRDTFTDKGENVILAKLNYWLGL
ncbi:MAG: DUF5916 domain-containing protein [Planctomycetota bacterium]|jgi:hypothetical protein